MTIKVSTQKPFQVRHSSIRTSTQATTTRANNHNNNNNISSQILTFSPIVKTTRICHHSTIIRAAPMAIISSMPTATRTCTSRQRPSLSHNNSTHSTTTLSIRVTSTQPTLMAHTANTAMKSPQRILVLIAPANSYRQQHRQVASTRAC